jgi:hypothetical protein
VQFKCYLGKYRPDLREVRIGETLKDFPRIPTPITLVEHGVQLACGHTHSVGLVFLKGKLLEAVCPYLLPDNTPYLPPGTYLPSGKNTERRALMRKEQERRFTGSFQDAVVDLIKSITTRQSLMRRIFKTSPYRNYERINGKWERTEPY